MRIPRCPGVLSDVYTERIRQEDIGLNKAAEGTRWSSCADPGMDGGDDRRYVVLGEEFGEVANAMLEGQRGMVAGDEALRAELVQVAAVAVAWAEAIDARSVPIGPAIGSVVDDPRVRRVGELLRSDDPPLPGALIDALSVRVNRNGATVGALLAEGSAVLEEGWRPGDDR